MKKLSLLSCFAAYLLLSGCLGGGRTPSVVTPGGDKDLGTVFAASSKIPIEVPTVDVNGEAQGLNGPRFRIWPLDLAVLSLRHPISKRCDASTGIRIGELTGTLRCGVGGETAAFSGKASLSWEWVHGAGLFTGVEGILHDQGWLLGFDSGITTGWWKSFGNLEDAVFGGDPDLLGSLILGPSTPLIAVSRVEFEWSSSVTFGVPIDRRGDMTLFFSPNIGVPIASVNEEYECIGCDARVDNYIPKLRLAIAIGFTGDF